MLTALAAALLPTMVAAVAVGFSVLWTSLEDLWP